MSGNECTWVRVITIDQQDSLTNNTKKQIVQHNEKVEQLCR